MNKKKIIIIIVAVVAASLLFGGASAVVIHKVREARMEEQAEMRAEQRKKRAEEKKKAEAEQTEPEKTEVEEKTVEENEPESEQAPAVETYSEIDDPLAGNPDVVYLGDKDGNDMATRNLVQKILSGNNIDSMSVLSVCSSDFAGDGKTEVFMFVGEYVPEEYMEYYEGSFWYADYDEVTELEASLSQMWLNSGKFCDFGKRRYFLISERYTTGAPTDMLTVVDGKPYKDPLSGYGNIEILPDLTGVIYHDTYDSIWDNTLGDYIGHTWKPYYFYYDATKDCLCEYESEPVSAEEINDLCGHDVLLDIQGAGGFFNSAYKRANGYVTVNYSIDSEIETQYCNATWDLDKNEYVRAYDGSEATLAGSDFGGTYERYLTELQ